MTTRADEIDAACRALARVNRRRDGWEPGTTNARDCCAAEGAEIDDLHEVQDILLQLGIDPRKQYRAGEVRALVLTDALAADEPTPFEIERRRASISDPVFRDAE